MTIDELTIGQSLCSALLGHLRPTAGAALGDRKATVIDALRNREEGRRPLEGTALRYLRAIKADPVAVARAQEETIREGRNG